MEEVPLSLPTLTSFVACSSAVRSQARGVLVALCRYFQSMESGMQPPKRQSHQTNRLKYRKPTVVSRQQSFDLRAKRYFTAMHCRLIAISPRAHQRTFTNHCTPMSTYTSEPHSTTMQPSAHSRPDGYPAQFPLFKTMMKTPPRPTSPPSRDFRAGTALATVIETPNQSTSYLSLSSSKCDSTRYARFTAAINTLDQSSPYLPSEGGYKQRTYPAAIIEISKCSTPPSSSPTCDSEHFSLSPPSALHCCTSIFQINHPDAVNFLLTPPDTPEKPEDSSPVKTKRPWNTNDPTSWPEVHLPFHVTPDCSAPTHVDEMLVNVHYKGAGALLLRDLLFKAKNAMEMDRETNQVGRLVFICWPFNVTRDGWWKNVSEMADDEVEVWREMMEEAL
ncbi:hypothetical protein EJ02DRAFT_464654 [Clathrospora elynae]|uniref:Uncharacterized protein n=1 Tax=Clathrospora elynae TaxID=706981 RepID=A0A6A5T3R9_9PLEO|nr:hypothetical protein EJ02DRAFT_464654 [Clathrospora elynae]